MQRKTVFLFLQHPWLVRVLYLCLFALACQPFASLLHLGMQKQLNATTLTAAGTISPPPGYSHLIFDDTFPGPGLDATKWVPEIGDENVFPWNNFGKLASPLSAVGNADASHYDAEYDSPAALTVHNGLTITARRDTSQPGYTWHSGVIDTHGKFTFNHGYVQIRAKMPDSTTGSWAQMWFLEGGGEIDLQESGYTECGSGRVNQCLAMNLGTPGNDQLFYRAQVDITAGYHIYGMQYNPGKSVTMYFDGIQTAQFTSHIPTGYMTIILDLAVAKPNASDWHTVVSCLTPSRLTMNVAEVQVWQ
jgi:beta-glucanase (GH16 family)